MISFRPEVFAVYLLLMGLLWVPQHQVEAQGLVAADGLKLATTNRCISCHKVDRKVVGPAFNAISERFAGQATAKDYLAASIRSGSSGRWGAVPMPRQSHVSQADAEALAAWILSLTMQDK